MKTLRILSVLAILAFSCRLQAQVGINTTNPDSTAALHIFHNSKGLLLPVVEASTRQEIVSGNAEVGDGLLVYDTQQKLYYFRNRTDKKWIVLNPWRVSDSIVAPWGNIRLGEEYKQRNVYIGANSTDTAKARLHVGGTMMVDDAVTAKNGVTITGGNVTVCTGSVSTIITDNKVKTTSFEGYGTIPLGGIIMWNGVEVPDGWALCNGQSSNGHTTPDLSGRFIINIGTASSEGLNTRDADPNKNYVLNERGGMNAYKQIESEVGSHKHTDAGHTHNTREGGGATGGGFDDSSATALGRSVETGYANIQPNQAVGAVTSMENRPRYYALAFIMRVK
jgi:microcystin-dependent protein